MMRGVRVYVGDGEGARGGWGGESRRRDCLDGEDGREEFGGVVFWCGVLEDGGLGFGKGGGEGGFGSGIAAEGDAFFEKG